MRKGTSSLFLASAFLLASATASAAPFKPPAQAEQPVRIAPEVSAEAPRVSASPTPLSASDRERYSERDRNSPNVKQFKGGDATVVIGASTATIILAVVLLIVLL